MNENIEISQTTRGILMSKSKNNKSPILVVDIEGSDSIERNEEERRTFARKTSLFALAIADVLLINMNAANVN